MKQLIFSIFALLIFFSCKNDDLSINKAAQTNPVTVITKSDINQAAILPEALEYYSNIAEMAKWYAKHPSVLAQSRAKSEAGDPEAINAFIAKFDEIEILDSTNVKTTFFELPEAQRDSFLSTYVVVEANELSKKLEYDTANHAVNVISERNVSMKVAFSKIKSTNGFTEDPYWKVKNIMTTRENARAEILKQQISKVNSNNRPYKSSNNDPSDLTGEFSFWKIVENSYGSIKDAGSPISLTPATFIDRIRPSIQPGRLLIALPGGHDTRYPLHYWYWTNEFDFGHVAVLTENAPAAADVSDITQISISTNHTANMHKEILKDDWCRIHGVTYVGQVYKVSYSLRWVGSLWRGHFTWSVSQSDVNNSLMVREVNKLIGTYYCNFIQIFTAKIAAPERMTCSSSAWWCAQKGPDVNISDFWSITILPAGVYLSDRVRLIDDTMN